MNVVRINYTTLLQQRGPATGVVHWYPNTINGDGERGGIASAALLQGELNSSANCRVFI